MPYNCEDCNQPGARMNLIFGIRLCKNCNCLPQYKLICKSKAMDKYFLNKNDLEHNYNISKEYSVSNPYNKSGPPMTLYLEQQIQQIFLQKYYDLINNILKISNPEDNIDNVIFRIKNYYDEKKNYKKQQKQNIIL